MALSGQIATFNQVPLNKNTTIQLLNLKGKGILKAIGISVGSSEAYLRITIDGKTSDFDGLRSLFGLTGSGSAGVWASSGGYIGDGQMALNLPFTTGFSIEICSKRDMVSNVDCAAIWAVEM